MTGKGKEEEGRRMGEGYKGSRISDRQDLPPQREAITGGLKGGHVGGACHRAYWQSVSKAAGRRGNNRSRDRRVHTRKEKSTLLRIPGNERKRDMWSGRW